MTFKKKGIMSLIIAFVLLFSGICMESVEADSLFGEPANVIDLATVSTLSEKLPNENAYTLDELSGRSSLEVIYQLRRSENRRELKSLGYILHTEYLYNNISNSDIVVERVAILPEYHSVSILTYIHDKDGKK